MTYRYIRASGVRNRVKKSGKRCGQAFLDELNRHVEEVVNHCCEQWNGSKKTLDATVVKLVIGKTKTV